jgi:drug/metabolite transporter (DMT)-like permease
MNKKIAGAIIIVCLIWGYLWVSVKIGLDYLPPFLFSAARLLIGGIALLVLQFFLRRSILPGKKEWGSLFTLSLLMCLGYYGLSTFGMQFVDSGLSSVLVYTMPIMLSVLAHFFSDERLTFNKMMGLLVGTMGLVMIMGPQMLHLKWNTAMFGEMLVLCSAFFWACSNLYTKKVFSGYDKIKLTMWQMLLGGLMLLVISLFTEPVASAQWTSVSVLSTLYNAFFGTAVAFVIWNWILSKIEASVASISIMSVPLLGLFFGWLQLGEEITGNIIAGAGFVCLGILFTSIQFKLKLKKDPKVIARKDWD